MDIDVFPNSVEYWGPDRHGVLPQRPGALDADPGRHPPDLRARAPGRQRRRRRATPTASSCRTSRGSSPTPTSRPSTGTAATGATSRWPGIVRYMEWDDMLDGPVRPLRQRHRLGPQPELEHQARGGKDVVRLQSVYGEGIENYMNDAPADLGIENNLGNPVRPIEGELLPVIGIVAFLDHTWNSKWTSAIGYSQRRDRQLRRPGAVRVQEGPVRPRQPAVHAGQERHGRRRGAVGQARELLRRLERRTTCASSSPSSPTSRHMIGGKS